MAKAAFWIVVLALGIGCSAGCNGGEETVPVDGTVTLDAQPLPDVYVIFYPANSELTAQKRYTGLTDAQGRFIMRGEAEAGGVPPGKYQVTLTTAVAKPTDTETTPLPPERVPLKHRKTEFEVPEGGTNEANFDLKTK